MVDEDGQTLAVMIAEAPSDHLLNGSDAAPLRYDRVLIS